MSARPGAARYISSRRPRLGELLALAGAIGLIVAIAALPWYEGPNGKLGAWDTFGPAVALLIPAIAVALLLAVATVSERSPALPVASAVWGILLGAIAVLAALVRLLERPQDASGLCAGAWLALAGALAITAGCWQSTRDERRKLYSPSDAPPRPPPSP
jgi:hypothetical protein